MQLKRLQRGKCHCGSGCLTVVATNGHQGQALPMRLWDDSLCLYAKYGERVVHSIVHKGVASQQSVEIALRSLCDRLKELPARSVEIGCMVTSEAWHRAATEVLIAFAVEARVDIKMEAIQEKCE